MHLTPKSRLKAAGKRILYVGLPVPRFVRPMIRCSYQLGVFAVESLAFIRKILWVEPVLRSVCDYVGAGLYAERLPYMRGKGRMRLGDRVRLSGRSCFYFAAVGDSVPCITVGDDTFIGNACTLSCATSIVIGSRCLISALVRIHDNDGHPLAPEKRAENGKIGAEDVASVAIGNNVWIGAESLILKGVTIGDDSVVGSRSVVTKDVPARVVVAGNPAKIVKEL